MPPAARSLRALARRGLPWLVAALILAWLIHQVDLAELSAAAARARLEVFVPMVAVAVLAWFALESTAFAYLFSRFNAPVSFGEARSLRGLTYLLTPINWNLGTGAIVLALRRTKGVGIMEGMSSLAFYALIDGMVLGCLVMLGVVVLPETPGLATLGRVALAFVLLQVGLVAFLMVEGPRWPWVQRVKRVRLLRTHGLARPADLAVLLLLRTVYFAGFVLFFFFGTAAFHVEVPLLYLAAAVPVILMIGGLPITPGGLGTQQAAMLYLFGPYGSEAQILAYGLAFPVSIALGRLPIGLLYLRDLRALRTGA